MGTISTMPAKAPTRSQYGMPIAQNMSESTVPTSTTRSSCPRTNAPSFRSMRFHVSLRGLCACAVGEARAIPARRDLARRSSRPRREDEEDADEHLDGVARDLDARLDQLVARGQLVEPPLEPEQTSCFSPARLVSPPRGSRSLSRAATRSRPGPPSTRRGTAKPEAAPRRPRTARRSGSRCRPTAWDPAPLQRFHTRAAWPTR